MSKFLNRIYKFANIYKLSVSSRQVQSLLSQVYLYKYFDSLGIEKFSSKGKLWEDECDVCHTRFTDIKQTHCSRCNRQRGPSAEKEAEKDVPHGPLRVKQKYATGFDFPGEATQKEVEQFFFNALRKLEPIDPLQLWRYTNAYRQINWKFAVPFEKNGKPEIKTYSEGNKIAEPRVFCAVFECSIKNVGENHRPEWRWKTTHSIPVSQRGVHSDINGYLSDFIKKVLSGSVKMVDSNLYPGEPPPPTKPGEILIPNTSKESASVFNNIKNKIKKINGGGYSDNLKRVLNELAEYELERNNKVFLIYDTLTNKKIPKNERIPELVISRTNEVFALIESRFEKITKYFSEWEKEIDSVPSFIKEIEVLKNNLFGKSVAVFTKDIEILLDTLKSVVPIGKMRLNFAKEDMQPILDRLKEENSNLKLITGNNEISRNLIKDIIDEVSNPKIDELSEFIILLNQDKSSIISENYPPLVKSEDYSESE